MDHIYIVAAVIIYLYKSTGRIQKKDLIKLILKYFKTDKIPIFIIKKREEMVYTLSSRQLKKRMTKWFEFGILLDSNHLIFFGSFHCCKNLYNFSLFQLLFPYLIPYLNTMLHF